MRRYNPKDIEPKWQKIWDERQTYRADLTSDKPKYIAMSMFNYPSGAGIHIGHAMNYTISEVMARFKRQQGYESYHPVGWDAFGLPAENYAIKSGVSPQKSMATIIPSYHQQYKAMGWSNDWSKEVSTHEPIYYKWTQWIFSQMFKSGLAYQDARMQWWCDKCQTVLANEQVIDGKCWRHDGADDPDVIKREVKQWFFKITEYADELLEATDALDWSEVVKTAQKNWIGKSVGAEVSFTTEAGPVQVFTTRPDTLFGATFLVLAPEHELVKAVTTADNRDTVAKYQRETQRKSDLQRQENKEKTGVFTGGYAINPATKSQIPIWIADYVLPGYGTGAIMAVPAHDERDNEFARKYDLPITQVVAQDFGTPLPDCTDTSGVNVIGYDPKTKRFMGLHNNNTNQAWLVGGGREDDETYEQAAYRELTEEAGYDSVSRLIQLGGLEYMYYYNDNKKSNRRASGYNFLAILSESDAGQLRHEDHEDFTVRWQSYDELYAGIEATKGGVEHWLNALNQAKEAARLIDAGEEYVLPCYHGEGVLVNSGAFDGISSSDAREQIVAWLEKQGIGSAKTTFKIRDWSVTRQRYWGAPTPIIHCPKDGAVVVPDEQLPVVLPELDDFAPSGDGRSALARASEWLKTTCPTCGGAAERETDTLDTYICSSWYFLRYFDWANEEKIFDSAIANKWMPIDFYNGGDHATAHMIYARFITRFFHKLGLVDEPEPFKRFLFNGKVKAGDGSAFSKSKGNGVDPLEIIEQGYGADALRTYLMFAAPLELDSRWDPQGVPGTYRFLTRIWNLVQEYLGSQESRVKSQEVRGGKQEPGDKSQESAEAPLRAVHPAIKKVTSDLEDQKYNTAIAAMMKLTNELYEIKAKDRFAVDASWRFALESLVMMVAPFAPHIAEELWEQLGHETSIHVDQWPHWDDQYLVRDTMTLAVQVLGKLRGEITVATDADKEAIESAALAHENVTKYLAGKKPTRIIYVPGRLVNIVA